MRKKEKKATKQSSRSEKLRGNKRSALGIIEKYIDKVKILYYNISQIYRKRVDSLSDDK